MSELEKSTNLAQPEDRILLSGPTGEHGISIPAQRECLEFEIAVGSDSAALYTLVAGMLQVTRAIRCMSDPKRGKLTRALDEIAAQSRVGIECRSTAIPCARR